MDVKLGKMTNPPQYSISRMSFEGDQVLAIELSETDPALKPCFITARGVQNGSFKRVADKDMKLSATEIFALQNAMVPSPADREVVPEASNADLDDDVIANIISESKKPHSKNKRHHSKVSQIFSDGFSDGEAKSGAVRNYESRRIT